MNYGYPCYGTPLYTMGNQNNGWCTFLLVLFIIFIICGLTKAL